VGSGVEIIDPATAVARELRRRLDSAALLNTSQDQGTEQFWTTGSVNDVEPVVRLYWRENATVLPLERTAEEWLREPFSS
jgi:glutamate racemase